MKIGILGGSFNPPHQRHLDIGLNLLKQKIVDKVIYVPVGDHYPKPDLASFCDRVEMLALMLEEYDQLEYSLLEKEKPHYTYETLDYFKKKYPNDEIYFILGSDNLCELETWKRYEYLLKNYHFLVIPRNKDQKNIIKNNYLKYTSHIHWLSIPKEKISSTEIRVRLKEEKEVQELSRPVREYIKKNKLYTSL